MFMQTRLCFSLKRSAFGVTIVMICASNQTFKKILINVENLDDWNSKTDLLLGLRGLSYR